MPPAPPMNTSSRNSKPVEKRKKYPRYFLACEGWSEVCYFQGLQTYLFGMGIQINLKYLDKDYSERSRTNPRDLVHLILAEKDAADFKEITVEKIVRKVDTWMREEKIIPNISLKDKHIVDKIISRMERRDYHSRTPVTFSSIEDGTANQLFEELDKCIKDVLADSITDYSIDDFKTYLTSKLKELGYEDGDKVCLICDRDFYDERIYDAALSHCKRNNIGFYVTNPCFEFWILLHFDEVLKIPRDKLLSNEMVYSGKTGIKERYTLSEVNRVFPEYRKSNVHFSRIQNRVQHAVDYEKTFYSEDEYELKTNLGSRLGILVSELMSSRPGEI